MGRTESVHSSLRDSLNILFKRKRTILFVFFATVSLVTVGTFLITPIYKAKAQVLVKMGRQNLYTPPNSTNSHVVSFDLEGQINSEIELIKSRKLAEKVINAIGVSTIYNNMDNGILSMIRSSQRSEPDTLRDRAILQFGESLTIEGIRKSDVVEISFQHSDPEMAAQIVNSLAEAYLEEHISVHKTNQSYKFFEEQSRIMRDKLDRAVGILEVFKRKHKVTALEDQQQLLLRRISDLRYDLNKTISDESETYNRIIQIQSQLAQTPESIPQRAEADHNAFLISRLEVSLVELQLKEIELLNKYTPDNRLVAHVREKIEIVQKKRSEYETKQYETNVVGLNITYQRLQEALFTNQSNKKALFAKKNMQQIQLDEYESNLVQLNKVEGTLHQLQQTVDADRQNYRLYQTKFEESRILDSMDKSKMNNVVLMKTALPPIRPIKPRIAFNIAIGLLMGLFGGLASAFIADYLDDSLEKPEDVEKILQLPVLTNVSEMTGDLSYARATAVPSELKISLSPLDLESNG